MSPDESRNGRETDSIPEGGVLAALPRARPQRASARRAAARAGTTKTNPAAKTDLGAKTSPTARARPATKTSPAAKTGPAAKKSPATKTKPVRTRTVKRPAAIEKPVSTRKRVAKPSAKPAEPPVPKQGYEPEDELELGKTVQPPSGVELAEWVADIVGELASSSLAAGGRLLKDAFSLLRRS
jgi:hypothetical protein